MALKKNITSFSTADKITSGGINARVPSSLSGKIINFVLKKGRYTILFSHGNAADLE
jgi:hypothetical protein